MKKVREKLNVFGKKILNMNLLVNKYSIGNFVVLLIKNELVDEFPFQ
jgi:hypothetical protein